MTHDEFSEMARDPDVRELLASIGRKIAFLRDRLQDEKTWLGHEQRVLVDQIDEESKSGFTPDELFEFDRLSALADGMRRAR